MACCHDHHLAPLIVVRVCDQLADLVVVYCGFRCEVLLERAVDEVDPSHCRLAQQAAAFHQVAEDVRRIGADLVQVHQ